IEPPSRPTIGCRSIASAAPMPTAFCTAMNTMLTIRNTNSLGPPRTSIRASAERPTVVKNISSRLSRSAMSNPMRIPPATSSAARRIATITPPTTGAGMLNRARREERAINARPPKSTRKATRIVDSRSSWIAFTTTSLALARAMSGQRLRGDQLESLLGVIAVNLLHVELAHEGDRLGGNDLSGDHDREPGRVGNDEVGGDELGTVFQPLVDVGTGQLDDLAVRGVIGHVERVADVADIRRSARIVPEHVVESAEVRQIRHVLHQRPHAGDELRACGLAALIELALDLPRDVGQRLQQQRGVAARVVDVRLQQDAVARRLVHLDVEAVRQQCLELRPVEAGPPADERQPGRVERELVLIP